MEYLIDKNINNSTFPELTLNNYNNQILETSSEGIGSDDNDPNLVFVKNNSDNTKTFISLIILIYTN